MHAEIPCSTTVKRATNLNFIINVSARTGAGSGFETRHVIRRVENRAGASREGGVGRATDEWGRCGVLFTGLAPERGGQGLYRVLETVGRG